MKDWLRFSVCYWHTFRGNGSDMFGPGTFDRTWNNGDCSIEDAKERVDAAFELFTKLGIEYYTFHDRDIAPEGKNLKETNLNLDKVVEELKTLQEQTGVKLLWGTANMFSQPRNANGAATNPDFNVYAYSGAQVKKMMEVTQYLEGEGFTFWGGREGYFTLLNTDLRRELDHLAAFFHMALNIKKKIGAKFQMYIEPKPREPTKHQYDYDAQTVISFLQTYGLQDHFKLNIEPNHTTLAGHEFEHDILMASAYGMLGSIDANAGDTLCGWDTDQFNMDVKKSAIIMQTVINQNGLNPGGLNFDCKVRRESTDLEDIFISHISAMDVYAQGLLAADKIISEGTLPNMIAKRYDSFNRGLGKTVEDGKCSFEQLEEYALKNECQPSSGQQELYEAILN